MDVKAVTKFAATFVNDTTSPATPRPSWLRRGRYDLVMVADVIIALICFAATNSTLTNENASSHGRHALGLLVLVAFVNSAPLVLRTRFPLGAWAFSAAAIIWTSLVIPPGSLGGPDVPVAGVLVYGLCLYAVAVRGRPRVVAGAAAVTIVGAAFIDLGAIPQAVFLTAVAILLGAMIRVRRSGDPVPLPDGVDLSAYRIVQEALSNAMRHAPGSHVRVHMTYRRDALVLKIGNDAVLRADPVLVARGERAGGGLSGGGGHGLVGMRERATMLGGSLEAGPTGDGGFQVTAVLPVDSPGEAAT